MFAYSCPYGHQLRHPSHPCMYCGWLPRIKRSAPDATTRDDNGPDAADEQLQADAARVDAMGVQPEYAEENQ
jgi:hypothetical protein